MKRTLWLWLTLAGFGIGVCVTHAESVRWRVVASRSRIGFVATQLGFAERRGEFELFSARVSADSATAKLTSIEALVWPMSVRTGSAELDEFLRSERFFDVARHPTIRVSTRTMRWDGRRFDGIAALTLRGRTREVRYQGSLRSVRELDGGRVREAVYEASAEISRQAFGLTFGLLEGIALVDDSVTILLEVETSLAASAGR